jgi:dehydrogenase/reductase SDR family protein 7B
MEVKDKIVWITGASSGIGEALAYAFVNENAKIIISSNQPQELEAVKLKCQAMGAEVMSVCFDLISPESIKQAADLVLQEYGKVDILINNGGISQRSFIRETPMDIDRKLMEINYFSGIYLTKLLLPSMIKQKQGHIAVTSSIVGKFGFPLRSAYSASKHAIQGFYETLRFEEKENNIKVTVIIPGRVRTNISINAVTKNGQAYGKMDDGQNEGITPEKSAKIIIRAIKRNKREVLVGGKELLMVHFRRFIPALFYRLASKIKRT